MKVFVFKSKSHKLMGGFTQDGTGSNLPAKFGKWVLKNELVLEADSHLIGGDPKKIIADIEKQGYSIQEAKIEFEEMC